MTSPSPNSWYIHCWRSGRRWWKTPAPVDVDTAFDQVSVDDRTIDGRFERLREELTRKAAGRSTGSRRTLSASAIVLTKRRAFRSTGGRCAADRCGRWMTNEKSSRYTTSGARACGLGSRLAGRRRAPAAARCGWRRADRRSALQPDQSLDTTFDISRKNWGSCYRPAAWTLPRALILMGALSKGAPDIEAGDFVFRLHHPQPGAPATLDATWAIRSHPAPVASTTVCVTPGDHVFSPAHY